MPKLGKRFKQLTNAFRYLARGDFSGLINRVKSYGRDYSSLKLRQQVSKGNGVGWGIICTPHTLFIARIISDRLAFHGIESEILIGSVKNFKHDFYIVLCAQMFSQLPPANKRFIFQLEQSVSSRWFTRKYMNTLKESLGVLEYSLSNIEFLSKQNLKYPKVHYLPIGVSDDNYFSMLEKKKKYDFVFYGDITSSKRRRKFIEKLQEKYNVKVCSNLFGMELYDILKDARAVINIHYYEGALLETPRICECISLGIPVLSEDTIDQGDYPELLGAIRFFEEGSVVSMMENAELILRDLDIINADIQTVAKISSSRFNFMMDRFLLAIGAIPANIMLDQPVYVAKKSKFFALSLPETIERRLLMAQSLPNGCELFDGIRHSLGWVGCGASFNALSRYAIANDIERLIVIEDDVELPENFDTILDEINTYLDNCEKHWDIFSGVMADVSSSAQIISVDHFGNHTYVTIDKMTSTVFNIYNTSALEMLAQWNPLNTDTVTNTIDRYLEQQEKLRVIVALPFIVGHKENATSTLWGFGNERYTPMIAQAQSTIERLVLEWQRTHSDTK